MTINILIADDHPIFLKGLKEVIESDEELKVVAMASNGQNAIDAFKSNKVVDVVVLDIDMPRLNGLEAAENIIMIREVPVIVLTMHKDKALFLKSLEIGVQGYLLKENAVSDVISAIHKVYEGNTYISPELSILLFKRKLHIDNDTPDYTAVLTPSEKRILRMIGEYKSSREIADALFISEKTVFNHRMNICKKLNLTGKNSLLRFAIENVQDHDK